MGHLSFFEIHDFSWLTLATKRRILELIGIDRLLRNSDVRSRHDASVARSPITLETVDDHFSTLTLVEMKTTKRAITDQSLHGFFFGATAAGVRDGERPSGPRYCFAFVVLNETNAFGKPFAVLLTLEEVEQRTHARRVQYQVNFKSGHSGQRNIERST